MSTKRKLPTKLGQPVVKPSAKPITKTALNDAHTVVSGGGQADSLPVNGKTETIEISSDSNSNSDGEEESEGEDNADEAAQADTSMTEAQQDDDEDANAEPTFGDLVRTTLEPIDVASAFPLEQTSAPNNLLAAPSSASLSTVLTQALKTNDAIHLESCLQTTDLATIRNTIQRLASPLASSLLSALATRLHRRPGRAGSLMVWIQWTLVAHGGYLATQKDLVKQLAALSRVVEERARGLNGLLMLKGKLDMLEAQGAMRKNLMGRNRDRGEDSDDDDGAVVYVEHSPAPEDARDGADSSSKPSSRRLLEDQSDDDVDAESEDSDDMPNTRADADSEDDESDDGSQGLIDDEAEESDEDDSAAEGEVDFEDEDEVDSGDESDDAAPARGAPPTKLQKTHGLFSKRH